MSLLNSPTYVLTSIVYALVRLKEGLLLINTEYSSNKIYHRIWNSISLKTKSAHLPRLFKGTGKKHKKKKNAKGSRTNESNDRVYGYDTYWRLARQHRASAAVRVSRLFPVPSRAKGTDQARERDSKMRILKL